MTNHERFLGLYNDLDNSLRKRYHNNDRTSSMFVKFVSDLNRTGSQAYMKMAKKLNMIRVIRNNLIHELDMNKDNFIEITDDTIKFLEDVISLLENPKRAKDIARPILEAYTIKDYANIKLTDLIRKMREKGYSQVPILSDEMLLKGVFSPNVLFEYVSLNPTIDMNNVYLKDVKELCKINKHFSETYLFINENLDEESIDDLYMNAINDNKKPGMMFVTQNGQPNEKIIGIIVLKDLLNASINLEVFK